MKQSTIDNMWASFPICLHLCLKNGRRFISWDQFRMDDIRLHVDAPEPWAASEAKILLRLLKELGTKSGEISRVPEGRNADTIKNRK
jgi:hypothetical protein